MTVQPLLELFETQAHKGFDNKKTIRRLADGSALCPRRDSNSGPID